MNALPQCAIDTCASERMDADRADQIRTSLDPLDRAIVATVDALSETPECINSILLVAHAIKLRKMDLLGEWGIALSDGLCIDNPRTSRIYALCKSGDDDAELGRLIRSVARDEFASACALNAEWEVTL